MSCKGLKGEALRVCLMKAAQKRRDKEKKAVADRTKKRDSLVVTRTKARRAKGIPDRSTSFKKK